MRKTEILSIRREHVNLQQLVIYIPKTKTKTKTKTGAREQPITADLGEYLAALCHHVAARRTVAFPVTSGEGRAHGQSGQAVSALRAGGRLGRETSGAPHAATHSHHAYGASRCRSARCQKNQRPQKPEHGRTLQPPERRAHSNGNGQAFRTVQSQNGLSVSLMQLHKNYTNAHQRKKPATDKVAGFLMPIRLVMAPRPGLEPGTYGLTVRRSTN